MITSLELLDAAECERVRADVHALSADWIERGAFHTLGAASYIDAIKLPDREPQYEPLLRRSNPVLRARFGWLHNRLLYALSVHLQSLVRTADELALPGFHVWQGLNVPTS